MALSNLPSFDTIQNILKGYSAAECHGFLAALISADPDNFHTRFMGEIRSFTEEDPDETLLLELSRITIAQLSSPDFNFQLLLPDDNESLESRSVAVSEWCQGFIYGIALTRPKTSEDVTEFITDLTEFTRMDFEEEGDEDDAIALEELIEFIRMGTMLTHQNLANRIQPTLH